VKKLIVLLFLIYTHASAQEVIKLGVTRPTLESKQGQFLKVLYTEIFNKFGLKLKVIVRPPIRLAKEVESGSLDGELVRMSGYKKPYLTRVNEPHFKFSISTYGINKTNKIRSTDDLRNTKISYRRGMKVVQNLIDIIPTPQRVRSFIDTKKALSLVVVKRYDYFVGVKFFTDEIIRNNEKQFKNKIFNTGILKADSAHMFLGTKFKHLTNKVSSELKKMKKNGHFNQLRKKSKHHSK